MNKEVTHIVKVLTCLFSPEKTSGCSPFPPDHFLTVDIDVPRISAGSDRCDVNNYKKVKDKVSIPALVAHQL